MKKFLTDLSLLLVLGTIVMVTACGDDDTVDPVCTFQTDQDCFCQNNPTDERCEDEPVCTFETDPECFCNENPTDANCDTGPTAPPFTTGYDFEETSDPADVFQDGFDGGSFDGVVYDSWTTNADPTATIQTGSALFGEDHLAIEFEVFTEGWAWVGNINMGSVGDAGTPLDLDVSGSSDPYLAFFTKSDGGDFRFEAAFNDADGQSGTNFLATGLSDSEWTLVALKLNTISWAWGAGPDWSDVDRVQLGFNMDGKAVGDIFTVEIDHIGLYDGLPEFDGTTLVIDQSNPAVSTIQNFDGVEAENVFLDGFDGGTYNGITYDSWTTNANPDASIVNGNAPQGDGYLSVDVEVMTTGWAWVGNVNAGMLGDDGESLALDLSEVEDPYLNFYAKTDGQQFLFECAINDDNGQSGFHINFEETDQWQLVSVRLDSVAWKWGGTDFSSEITRFQLGFNVNEQQEVGDIITVDLDYIHLTSGPATGADVLIDEMPNSNGRKED